MPRRIQAVVVFGDSLSDIGKKWTTKSGRAARLFNEMYVSPTGRFSDCRNWTDFMYEAAGGASLIGTDANQSYVNSQNHMAFTAASAVNRSFYYANYAEGGACGDTPREKSAFLGTFKDQVDAFETELRANLRTRLNFLFIIWFGANDLFTANRPHTEMGVVASVIAEIQRNRLKQIVAAADADPKFIFVNLARPLTAVRYAAALDAAKRSLNLAVQAAAHKHRNEDREMVEFGRYKRVPGLGAWSLRMLRMGNVNATAAVNQAATAGWASAELAALVQKVEQLRLLEHGVMHFNLELARIARGHGDRVAEIGSCISVDSMEALVSASPRLLAGAAPAATSTHVSARDYDRRVQPAHLTTIDQVHPTDEVYRLIWKEILQEILASDCTFGTLPGVAPPGTLSTLAGPTAATRTAFTGVMAQLKATRPPTP